MATLTFDAFLSLKWRKWRLWKKNGDQKTYFGPHGDPRPQIGTNVWEQWVGGRWKCGSKVAGGGWQVARESVVVRSQVKVRYILLPGTFLENITSAWENAEVNGTFLPGTSLWKYSKYLGKCPLPEHCQRNNGCFYWRQCQNVAIYVFSQAQNVCCQAPKTILHSYLDS